MNLTLILGILKEGLTLWSDKQASKYLEKVISLEKEYHEELSKPLDDRSDLKLDRIMLELTIIAQSFAKYPGKSK